AKSTDVSAGASVQTFNAGNTGSQNSVTGTTANTASRTAAKSPVQDQPIALTLGNTTITPVGFVDFTTVYRTTNSTNATATNFGAIPFNNQVQGHTSEMRLTGQDSRFGIRVDTKIKNADVTGYVETDFNGNDPLNVFVTTNSHTNRLRQYWADVRDGNLEFVGGQSYSLFTPNRHGLSPFNDDLFLTYDLDQNFQAGLVWARQAGVRFIYHFNDKFAAGVAVENPQQFIGAGEVVFPFSVNAQLGVQFDTGQNPGIPNVHPDFMGKLAYDTKLGDHDFHIEAGGMLRTFRVSTVTSAVGFISDRTVGGAGEVNFNAELFKNFHLVSNNFFSAGGGRYIGGLAPDVVVAPTDATNSVFRPSLVDSFSTLQGFEAKAGDKVQIYGYYSGVFARRNFFLDTTNPVPGRFAGFGAPNSPNLANRAIQEGTGGLNYTFWKDPRWGAFQIDGQISYLTRAPWFVAPGAPKNAHAMMTFFTFRYILPGSAPKTK
ncbi:MAG TPA: hypothetical protein VFC63_21335, partial [Blastocatellia bacterium]|nr:hypothetical protein [Blastocatellia bacterium]